jgi:putative flippase GtrA
MKQEVKKIIDREIFSKFLAVGIIGMLIDNTVLFVLHNYTAIHVILGKIISAETSILAMFLINDQWTFKEHKNRDIFRRLVRSNSVRIIGLIIGTAGFYTFYLANVPLLIANVMGIGIGFVFNYFFENLLTWEKINAEKLAESL